MKRSAFAVHRLYQVAFGRLLSDKSRTLGKTLKAIAQANEYSGKVLRRGTPGAFGFVAPRPTKGAARGWRGRSLHAPGNSRDRRFARRHRQHFEPV